METQLQRLSAQMDKAVYALQEQSHLEQEVQLLIKTSANLIEKLEARDKEIMHLKSELMLIRQQLAAFRDVETIYNDE